MRNHPLGIPALLSAGLGIATTAMTAALTSATGGTLLILFLLTFLVALGGIYVTLERVYFRKLRRLKTSLGKLDIALDHIDNDESEDILTDISTRIAAFADEKQHEIDRLNKQEAFRKNFIADVSHELKTPIFAAQGFIHTLIDGAVKDKSVRKKFLKKAMRSLDGLDVLVQDLLTLSNIETGQVKMHMSEVDLYALTVDVFDQFRVKSAKKGIELQIEGPVRKITVYADGHRISQVMTNLISNAINHSAEADKVVVSFNVGKEAVVTYVRDFGEGIDAEHLPHIFERFYRADKSRSRAKGGTGLGLAIVKHILEEHNARPEVETTPGKGSTFSFKLSRFPRDNDDDGPDYEASI